MITRTLTLGFLILIVLAPILTCAAKPEATAGPVRVADAAPAKVDVASVQSEYHWQTEKYEVMLRTRGQSIPWDRQGVHGLDLDTVPGVVVESLRFRPIGQEDWFHCAFSSHGDLTQITEVSAVVEGSMI